MSKNQKLGLLCALLEHGAWSYAKQLLDRFPEEYPLGKSLVLHNFFTRKYIILESASAQQLQTLLDMQWNRFIDCNFKKFD